MESDDFAGAINKLLVGSPETMCRNTGEGCHGSDGSDNLEPDETLDKCVIQQKIKIPLGIYSECPQLCPSSFLSPTAFTYISIIFN